MLGHSGERVGGNDYDQALAFAVAVPHLGWQAPLRSGLPVPNHYLVDAITVNDVNAQARFYSAATLERLQELLQDCLQPAALERLLRMQRSRGGYRLLGEVETAKIGLSSVASVQLDLGFIEAGLALQADQGQLADAVAKLLDRLERTVRDVTEQAKQIPDLVYLTGGMAQSPVVRERVRALVGDVPLLDSDHFTSVTEGLTRWAQSTFSA